MNFEEAFYILLGFTLVRELWSMHQIQKLLDKAMSRSHHEYQIAQGLSRPREVPKENEEMPEDLGALQGIL